MPDLAQSNSQNNFSGRVILKESGVGIPNLLVVLYDAVSSPAGTPTAPAVTTTSPYFRTSVITDSTGSFAVSVDDADFKVINPQEKRPDLHMNVLAPEEPGVAAAALLLFSSIVPRPNAGRTEQYIVRLSTDLLQKFGIPVPASPEAESAQNVVGKLNAVVKQQNNILDGAVTAAKQLVDAHRTRFANFKSTFKPTLVNSLSKLPSSPLNPDRFVAAGDSVFTKASAAVQQSVQNVVNSDDPTKRAPARGYISLTSDQVNQLRTQVGADGTVPSATVAALKNDGQSGGTTFLQAIDRLPLCQPSTPSVDCTSAILDSSPAAPPDQPPPAPGPTVTTITNDDIPRYLARLTEPLTAPEEQLVLGLMPVATRDSVQSSIQSFTFDPSPADVPAFHDFNNLQIAFDYVWQEAIDQGILDLAQNAYETIVGLGGNPDHPDYQNIDPLRTLIAEGGLVVKANAAPSANVRDHRDGAPEGGVTVTSTGSGFGGLLGGALSAVTSALQAASCPYAADAVVRDHRVSSVNPIAIEDPIERLPALLQALNKKLLENYNFTVYAANAKERSVNFGILNTYRQIWTPLSYQAGALVKSIPLAPKQTQKVVITRKTVKKRTQKELENNLRVLKQETSETNRAEQEIATKASTNTSFSFSNEAKGDYEVGSDTATTSFKLDAAKSSDDVKKSFHEAVFKASQEFKQEKTTEINTEETHEFESVETTEITNPNDEIAVTFLFYELQRRYRLYERLYRVQPVVLVAQEFPNPQDIDQAWLVRHDWILKRTILDDSFLATLDGLAQTAGDEIAIAEMKANVNQQRCIVGQLRQELAIASQQAITQRALMDQAVYQKSGASSGGILGAVENIAGSVVDDVSKFIFGGDSSQNDSNRQAMQERADEAANQVRDLTFRLEREVTALNALTETYTKALREHNNHLTEIARLKVHVKDNIMYYMQAILTHEPPDQRFFRLHNTPVPDLTHTNRGFRIDFDHPIATAVAPPHQALARFGGRDAKVFPLESVTKFNNNITYKPLSEVADVGNLLGFKGNYAIFPLYQSNALTDFMMDPYIDQATGQLADPSDPVNWSLDEFSEYVCCLKKKLTDDEFQSLLPTLQTLYRTILTDPTRGDDVLIVPTNSLFIEALPAEHTLLEKFKLDHRMIDVKDAQEKVRGDAINNLRQVARILAGERGDPHIDKKILIEGGNGFVIPTGDQ